MNVIELPPGIQRRVCPDCGYLMDQMLIEMARHDYSCPGCGKHALSEFVADTWITPEPPPAKKRAA